MENRDPNPRRMLNNHGLLGEGAKMGKEVAVVQTTANENKNQETLFFTQDNYSYA